MSGKFRAKSYNWKIALHFDNFSSKVWKLIANTPLLESSYHFFISSKMEV